MTPSNPQSSANSTQHCLRVIDPGFYTLVVDFGRPSSRGLGVPLGGAADRTSLALGNALVGNPINAPALEISLKGPTLQAECELACVVFGAPFSLASDRQPRLVAGTTFNLSPGESLIIGGSCQGMRAYFCVRGGLPHDQALGSFSSLAPLTAGVALPCSPGRLRPRYIRPDLIGNHEPHALRIVDGPQRDWFKEDEYYRREYTVSPASNRMGLRLQGTPLKLPRRELVSEPVCPGAVQVTSDGQCIILGVDGQTIGGYPKIAQVISADLDKLGQLRPHDLIQFVTIARPEAEVLYRKKWTEIHDWEVRLRETI